MGREVRGVGGGGGREDTGEVRDGGQRWGEGGKAGVREGRHASRQAGARTTVGLRAR